VGYSQHESYQIKKEHKVAMEYAEGRYNTQEDLLEGINEAFKDKEALLNYIKSEGMDPELLTTTQVQLETTTIYKDVVKYIEVDKPDHFVFDDKRLRFIRQPNSVEYSLNQHFVISDIVLSDDKTLTKTYKLFLEEIDKDGIILSEGREIETNIKYLPTKTITSDNYSFLESLHLGLTGNVYTDLSKDLTGHTLGTGAYVEYRRQLLRSNHDQWGLRFSFEQRIGLKNITEIEEYRLYSMSFTWMIR